MNELNELELAAKKGNFDFIKQLKYNDIKNLIDIKDFIDIIVEYNHFEILKWFFENHNIKNIKSIMDTAARFGHFDIVCWLQKNTFTGCNQHAVMRAIENDHVKVVKFLYEHYPNKFKKQFTKGIKSIEMLIFFKDETNIELNYTYLYNLIKNNNLDDIKFLHNLNLLKFDPYIIKIIFVKCNIDIIDFIYTNYKTKGIKKYIKYIFYECLYENRVDSMIYIFNKLKKLFNPETISYLIIHFKDNEFIIYIKNNIDKYIWEDAEKLYIKKYNGHNPFTNF